MTRQIVFRLAVAVMVAALGVTIPGCGGTSGAESEDAQLTEAPVPENDPMQADAMGTPKPPR